MGFNKIVYLFLFFFLEYYGRYGYRNFRKAIREHNFFRHYITVAILQQKINVRLHTLGGKIIHTGTGGVLGKNSGTLDDERKRVVESVPPY